MSTFQKFDPWAEIAAAPDEAAKAAKAEENRGVAPAKAVLKSARVAPDARKGGHEAGHFSGALAGPLLKFAPPKPADEADSSRSDPSFSSFSNFSRAEQTENHGEHLKASPTDIPCAWTAGVARLRLMAIPPSFVGKDWPEPLVSDAERFLARWGPTAARLGWPDWALWGMQRQVPSSWRGRELVALLGGRPVVALSADEAVIEVRPGKRQAYRRPPRDPLTPAERCMLWELD